MKANQITSDQSGEKLVDSLIQSTDAFIEYATKIKKFSDVDYYQKVRTALGELRLLRGNNNNETDNTG